MQFPDHLLLGHPVIDEQHRLFYRKVDEFHRATQLGTSAEQLRQYLGYLHDYTVTHFRTEEQFMDEMHYPAKWEHKVEHYSFWRQVLGLMDYCEKNSFTRTCGDIVHETVMTWLKNHIEEEDRALVEWIRAKEDGML